MMYTKDSAEALANEYGLPLYLFDEAGFINNYKSLETAFHSIYTNYRVSYSFKTNYTPYIAATVKKLGGSAEVVSGMELEIARRLNFPADKIIFNGPDKGEYGIEAFISGCMVNADSMEELRCLCSAATLHPERQLKLGLRVNVDAGQNFISRFGIDPEELPEAFEAVGAVPNLKVAGLHCHISRCRGLEAWQKRAETMLALADRYFDPAPEYIDLGSGMYGSMAPEFAAQFSNVPTYEEYAGCVAGMFASHYSCLPEEYHPLLYTEPGTTLINRFVEVLTRVQTIKNIRGKAFAVLDCSIHNLGETCTLKSLPYYIIPCGQPRRSYDNIDFTGYTCLEQDVMLKDISCGLAPGDYVVFDNAGGYSNVLKPPFIRPGCAMAAVLPDGTVKAVKRAERFDDLLGTYFFPLETDE